MVMIVLKCGMICAMGAMFDIKGWFKVCLLKGVHFKCMTRHQYHAT